MIELTLTLTEDQLEQLAERLLLLLDLKPEPKQWLNTKEAAAHLSCTPNRLYDLVQLRRLKPCRDGRRLLFKRSDLDAYLEAG